MNDVQSTSRVSALGEQYRRLPRAMKWLAWLALGMVIYFLIIEPITVSMSEYEQRSQVALANIERYSQPDLANRSMIADGRKRWGEVLPPGEDDGRRFEARSAIIDVLGKHGLTSDRVSLTERSSTKLKMTENATTSVEYWKAPIEVKFSAKPHIAMDVIGELEMVPSIAQLSSVRIRRQTDRAEVEVTLVADAWFVK